MKNLSKKISILLLCIFYILFLIIYNINKSYYEEYTINEVISPCEIITESDYSYKLEDCETFDLGYTEHNKKLAKKLNMTEDEGFIFGAFGKYWANNILSQRTINIKKNDFVSYKFVYMVRLKNSPYYFKDGKPHNRYQFEKQLKFIRRGKFVIVDLDTDKTYEISKENAAKLKNYIIARKSHVKNVLPKLSNKNLSKVIKQKYNSIYSDKDVKIVLSDLTSKLLPDRNCSSDICKTILSEIKNSKNTIDLAIYGYSRVPEIEKALINAHQRGVKIRLVYDLDKNNENIYPDTKEFVKAFKNNSSDINSQEVNKTMHNKFYIFDNKKVITGSANLSHTDMSGFNTNVIFLINSPEIAEFYTKEFNQMYEGQFHNQKISYPKKEYDNIQVYFSPQDKAIKNGIIPIIKNAKKYIYISAFVITEKDMTQELINAKNRGVDVKIIADALNASNNYSKHKELRNAGIYVKAENYAGKMHSKVIISDDIYFVSGSMNFSYNGENYNDENCIILKNPDAVKFYREFFLYQWNKIPNIWLKRVPRAEGHDSIGSCSDGIDNNYDGNVDMQDDACK